MSSGRRLVEVGAFCFDFEAQEAAASSGAQGGREAPGFEKQRRGVPWGPWSLAPLHPRGGQQRGWGATCGGHRDAEDGQRIACKKTISQTGMSNEECRIRMKMWLLAGVAIEEDDPRGRSKHMAAPFKTEPLRDETALDAQAELL